MKDKPLTKTDKINKRYLKALLAFHCVNLSTIARDLDVSLAYVSMVVSGKKAGTKKKGLRIRQIVADALGVKVEDI